MFGWLTRIFKPKSIVVSDRELELIRQAEAEYQGRDLPVGELDLPSPTGKAGIRKSDGKGMVERPENFSQSSMIDSINERFRENELRDRRN
jgi:hypothetical protein